MRVVSGKDRFGRAQEDMRLGVCGRGRVARGGVQGGLLRDKGGDLVLQGVVIRTHVDEAGLIVKDLLGSFGKFAEFVGLGG